MFVRTFHLKPPIRKNLPNISQDAESWKILQDPVPISKLMQLSLGIPPGKKLGKRVLVSLTRGKYRVKSRKRTNQRKSLPWVFHPVENPGRIPTRYLTRWKPLQDRVPPGKPPPFPTGYSTG